MEAANEAYDKRVALLPVFLKLRYGWRGRDNGGVAPTLVVS